MKRMNHIPTFTRPAKASDFNDIDISFGDKPTKESRGRTMSVVCKKEIEKGGIAAGITYLIRHSGLEYEHAKKISIAYAGLLEAQRDFESGKPVHVIYNK